MLVLPIKKKWFDMILSGEKKEEYREIKPYYERRFYNYFRSQGEMMEKAPLNEWLVTDLVFDMVVKFRNGYSVKSPSFVAKVRLTIGEGKPEWGAEEGKRYYVLRIHKILEVKDGKS